MNTTISQPMITESISGQMLDYTHIDEFKTSVEEIALLMSRTPVNGGHQLIHNPYSLAHHALWVQRYILMNTGNPYTAMQAMLYRAHEVYSGSYPSPVRHLSYLREQISFLESQVQSMVYESLGIEKPAEGVRDLLDKTTLVAQAMEAKRFSPSRSYSHILTEIPADADAIEWDHNTSYQVFCDFMQTFEILAAAVATWERDQ